MTREDTHFQAEIELRDLVSRYSDAVNRRDAEAWGQTWSREASWEIMGTVQQGRESIVEFWSQVMSGIPLVLQEPTFGTLDFSVASSELQATGRWYIHEITKGPEFSAETTGVYHDRYVHEDGCWRFSRRRFDVLYRDEKPLSGNAFPFPEDAE